MAISKERIEAILGRFSLLFPVPNAQASSADVVDVWHGLFGDADSSLFDAAARSLVLTLRRFPCPADFVALMPKTENEAKEVAHV